MSDTFKLYLLLTMASRQQWRQSSGEPDQIGDKGDLAWGDLEVNVLALQLVGILARETQQQVGEEPRQQAGPCVGAGHRQQSRKQNTLPQRKMSWDSVSNQGHLAVLVSKVGWSRTLYGIEKANVGKGPHGGRLKGFWGRGLALPANSEGCTGTCSLTVPLTPTTAVLNGGCALEPC